MRATACMVVCPPLQASVFCFGGAGLETITLSLSWVGEGSPNRHAQNSDGDADIVEVLSYPLCFWSIRLVAVALGRSSWW